jgi:hypothetical protein
VETGHLTIGHLVIDAAVMGLWYTIPLAYAAIAALLVGFGVQALWHRRGLSLMAGAVALITCFVAMLAAGGAPDF